MMEFDSSHSHKETSQLKMRIFKGVAGEETHEGAD